MCVCVNSTLAAWVEHEDSFLRFGPCILNFMLLWAYLNN